jgi:hypothetical protein
MTIKAAGPFIMHHRPKESGMRFTLKSFVLGCSAIFTALQIVPPPVPLLTPATPHQTAHLQNVAQPQVRAVLERACKDCHSNETAVPWYGHVAPVSWLLANHVEAGRKKLNFSDWETRGPSAGEMGQICDAVSDGSMPIRGYTLIHRDARLSRTDVDAVCSWADTLNSQKSISQHR